MCSWKTKIFLIVLLPLILLIAVVVGFLIAGSRSDRYSPVAHTVKGHVVKLERYAFKNVTVRYELPNRPLVSWISRLLPKSISERFKLSRPQATVFVSPNFPNESILSAAFSFCDASGRTLPVFATRMIVLDENGQGADLCLNYGAMTGVFESSAFPRRAKELHLRLMWSEELEAEFIIPNPCPGPHPRWQAAALPCTVTNGALEITLEKFIADSVTRQTRFVFLVRENGQETAAWLPSVIEVADATGNHWSPGMNPFKKSADANTVTGSFLGALWPEEDAWRLRITFSTIGGPGTKGAGVTVNFLAKPEQVKGSRTLH